MKFGKPPEQSKASAPHREFRKILMFAFAVALIAVFLWLSANKVLEQYQQRTDKAVPVVNENGQKKTLPPGEEQVTPPEPGSGKVEPPQRSDQPGGTEVTPGGQESTPIDLHHGMLNKEEDYKGIIQNQAYNFILRKVHQMSQAEIKMASRRNLGITAGKLLFRPDEFRGDFFQARGTVVHIDTLKLNTNPVNVEDVYEAYLVDLSSDKTDGYYVHVIERPKMPRLGVDQATVDGVFFKIYRYETRGGEARIVPFIFGKRLVVEEAPKMERSATGIEYIIIALIIAAFGSVLLLSLLTRKGDASMMSALGKIRVGHVPKKTGPDGGQPASPRGESPAPPAGGPPAPPTSEPPAPPTGDNRGS